MIIKILIPIILLIIIILLISGVIISFYIGIRIMGYASKSACSLLNITKLSIEDIKNELAEDFHLLKYINIVWDKTSGNVTCSLFGLFKRTAVYRSLTGAVLTYKGYENKITNFPQPEIEPETPFVKSTDYFEDAKSDTTGNNFQEAFDYAFSEPEGGKGKRRTRAVLVIHKNRIVAEKYASGFSDKTLLPGWSMSKSILNIAFGIRIQQGKISFNKRNFREEWKNDKRKGITYEDLFRMGSNLKWQEKYDLKSNALNMLFNKPDMGSYTAAQKRLSDGYPNFNYSSGTTNILSQELRKSFNSDQEYVNFLWNDLLMPLGIRNAKLEFDASGTWTASSFMFATAVEWALIGRLILNKGIINGKRLLPEWWIEKSMFPGKGYKCSRLTGNKKGLAYGMHWWLNKKDSNGENWMPEVPDDAVNAIGHLGQYLTVIPSKELIVVRLGLSRGPNRWDHNYFLSKIISAL